MSSSTRRAKTRWGRDGQHGGDPRHDGPTERESAVARFGLETFAAPNGTVSAGEGWTDLVITPERGVRTVDALVTGFHEPRASHLAMLEAIAGRGHLAIAYRSALDHGYLWHEFGDVHLLARKRTS